MKLTTRCGEAAVAGPNEALLAKAAEAKLLRTSRLRADTTVVPANVCYPTDSGLLARAVRRIAVTGRRIQAAGGARRTRMRDRRTLVPPTPAICYALMPPFAEAVAHMVREGPQRRLSAA
jgi:hypothetical protein